MEKKVNYTDEQTSQLVGAYEAVGKDPEQEEARAKIVAEFADTFGKKPRSIIAKLAKEGVYIKPVATTKTGQPAEKKETIAEQVLNLADSIGLNVGKLAAIGEHNTKQELLVIREAFSMLQDAEDYMEEEREHAESNDDNLSFSDSIDDTITA